MFLSEVGVAWQGGGKGRVVFEVWVDGEKQFESPPMSDQDPAKPVRVDLEGGMNSFSFPGEWARLEPTTSRTGREQGSSKNPLDG